MKKRLVSGLLVLCMVLSMIPTWALAMDEDSGLCIHHAEHDESCGYIAAVEGHPCTHEHTSDCYRSVTVEETDENDIAANKELACPHIHDEFCGYSEADGEESCTHEHTENCYQTVENEQEIIITAPGNNLISNGNEGEDSEVELDCQHTHDKSCGYVEAVEGHPCTYVCEICNKNEANIDGENNEDVNLISLNSETAVESNIWDGTTADSYAGGDGTSGSPYLIETAEQLKRVSVQINSGAESGKYYKLIKDIYLNDISSVNSWAETGPQNEWVPIGNPSTEFSGNFDGQNHIIYGLYISTNSNYQGLFGVVKGDSNIKSLGIEESYVKGGNYVGGLCGHRGAPGWLGNDELSNCHNGATVVGTNYVGGLLGGASNGTSYFYIKNCYNTGTVSGEQYIGGITGNSEISSISDSYNTGAVTGSEHIGGIAGKSMSSSHCWNAGEIRGTTYVGGIFGEASHFGGSSSSVVSTFNAGIVAGDSYVGGIIGYVTTFSELYTSTISDCYNVGCITGAGNYVAGVVGNPYSEITNCYNAGTCTFAEPNKNTAGAIYNNGATANSGNLYFLAGCCGEGYHNGWSKVKEISDEEMRGSDFVSTLNNGGQAWVQDTKEYNSGYPILNGIDYEIYAEYIKKSNESEGGGSSDDNGSSVDDFDINIYRANKLLDDLLSEKAILENYIAFRTPCNILIPLLQESGFENYATAWERLTTLLDAIDKPSSLGDFVLEKKDIYSAIILNMLEVSTTHGLVDSCNALIKDAKSYSSELKTVLKTMYDIDVTTSSSFKNLSFDQQKTVQEWSKKYFEYKYPNVTFINDVFKNFGTFLSICDDVETYMERCATAVALVNMDNSLKTVIRTMYKECPDSNLNLKLALLDCIDIMDSSILELEMKLYTDAWSIAGVQIAGRLVDELWNSVKKICNVGFPCLDIILAGYKTGKFISNTLFSTDSTIEQYCKMMATINIEDLVNAVYEFLETQYQMSKRSEDAAAYLNSIDVLFATRDQDCISAYKFIDILDNALVNRIGALFDKTGSNQRETMKSNINSIQKNYTLTYESILTSWISYLEDDYPNSGLEQKYSWLKDESYDRILSKKYVADCPVDIYIYDMDNTLVAYVVDNKPYCSGNITMIVDGDTKIAYFYNDEEYQIKYVGNDTGTMDLTITEYDEDESALRSVYFYDIQVTSGRAYESIVNGNTLDDVTYYFTSEDAGTLIPDLDTYQPTKNKHTVNMVSGSLIIGGELFLETVAYPNERLSIYAYVPEGYDFVGWTSNAGTDIFANVNSYATTIRVPDANITVEAILRSNGEGSSSDTPSSSTYTITFDLKGGNMNFSSMTTGAGGKLTRLPTPTRSGYIFNGWHTAANGGRKVDESEVYTKNTTLYAQWTQQVFPPATPDTYTITFDGNGGNTSVSTMTTGTDGKLSELPNATRSGYTFGGWYTASSGGTKITTNTVFDTDTTIYAQWTRNSDNNSGGGSSDGGNGASASSIIINNTSHGTVTATPKNTGKGGKVTLTVKPDTGYVLDTITVKDTSGKKVELTKVSDTQYTFIMPASRVTVDAKFISDGSQSEQPLIPSQTFDDVPASYWAYTEINWASANGIMNGTGNRMFNPKYYVTRQQAWMVLGRMAGANPTNMSAARDWAISNGISDGTNPGNSLTRQQLVALLYRYAQLKGYLTGGGVDISTYPDNASMASYAHEAMAWAVGNGIITGTSDGRLNPTGTATRAQFAVIMYRFNQKITG